jgi:hypothetical protein
MAMDFDWTQDNSKPQQQQQPERKGFEPLPPGEYAVVISDQKTKANKAGTGEYLELTLVIEDGANRGRRIWERLNLKNPSQRAVEIARDTVEKIKEVTGIAARSADDLVGGRCRVTTSNDEYGTKVKSYLPLKAKPATAPKPSSPDDDLPF